jgi:hypothetical protein
MSVLFRIILWPFVKVIELLWWLCKKCLSVLFAIFLGIFMITIVLLIFPNTWLPVIVDKYIENKTGFSLNIEKSKCNLFKGHFEFCNILMINPAHSYPVDHALSIEVFNIDIPLYHLWKSLWKNDELIISNIYLDIDDITITRNAQGKINFVECFDSFDSRKRGRSTALPDADTAEDNKNKNAFSYVSQPHPTKDSSSQKWRIEQLTLHLDSLRWKDFKSEKPQEQSFDLFYRHQWNQITSLQEITDTLSTDFKPYGISFLLQSIFSSFLNLPGVSHAHGSLQALQSLGKGILSGVHSKIQSIFTKTTTDNQ